MSEMLYVSIDVTYTTRLVSQHNPLKFEKITNDHFGL